LTVYCDNCWQFTVILVDSLLWYLLTLYCDTCWQFTVITVDSLLWYLLTVYCDTCWQFNMIPVDRLLCGVCSNNGSESNCHNEGLTLCDFFRTLRTHSTAFTQQLHNLTRSIPYFTMCLLHAWALAWHAMCVDLLEMLDWSSEQKWPVHVA